MNRIYACIDLKSFYASVECVQRGLDPLTTNLVVADASRTEKTICLAVSPSLKKYGIPGRARLFEVVSKVREINYDRRKKNRYRKFISKSYDENTLLDYGYELDYIVAKPRMAYYIKYSTDIYNIYLKYLSKDDIYVYSIDEVFCDITPYLKTYNLSPRELITKIIHDIYETTGITATAGIGTNLYLAKVAMDIVAKKCKPDKYNVRIASLNEIMYKKLLWDYQPLTDFWRIGPGICKRLNDHNIYTMGDIARCFIQNEDLLYKLFGINAELIIDHAFGVESCTIDSIKSYKPQNKSVSIGQVLHEGYNYEKTKLIVKEMCVELSLLLTKRKLITDKIVLHIGYDALSEGNGDSVIDRYGRSIPRPSHGTINLEYYTSSCDMISSKVILLFDMIINKNLLVRRINISANSLVEKTHVKYHQLDLFSYNNDFSKMEDNNNKLQNVIINIKNKFGKNAIFSGMDLLDGATTIGRNKQIGGHSE